MVAFAKNQLTAQPIDFKGLAVTVYFYSILPTTLYNRRDDRWEEGEGREVLPWRPDAFFTLLLDDPAGEELELGFAYEYQQTTGTALERLLRKYRSHFSVRHSG